MVHRAEGSGGLRRHVALDGHAVGVLDGAQPSGDPGFAGGDGLAVAPAVGALREALAELLDLADVGLPLVGVRGDGEEGSVGGGGVQDDTDGWLSGSRSARAMIWGPSASGQACAGWARPCMARSWRSASIRSARSS